MADSDSKLGKKQRLFIENYLVTFNATKAAIAAGYSGKTAYSIGNENLKKPEIKAVIDKRVREIIAQTDDKRAYLINFWQEIIDKEDVSERDRLKASENLAKYLAMFTERLEVSGKDGEPMKILWE